MTPVNPRHAIARGLGNGFGCRVVRGLGWRLLVGCFLLWLALAVALVLLLAPAPVLMSMTMTMTMTLAAKSTNKQKNSEAVARRWSGRVG